MNRFPISRVDHVRALPDRRLVVRARCPMCGRAQLELPIHPSTRCRDCGVGLRYVSNHLVPRTPTADAPASDAERGVHPPVVGNGKARTRAPAKDGDTAGDQVAELDWVFAVESEEAGQRNGREKAARLTEATRAQFIRTSG